MRKWLAAVMFLVVAASGSAQKHKAAPFEIAKVGVAERVFHPTEHRNWRGAAHQELRCTIWYPAVSTAVEVPQFIGPQSAPLFQAGTASPNAPTAQSMDGFPVVLLSHGSGGSALQMAWLGTALARAGYVAVAVNHPGNNATEALTPEGFVLWWERATDLSDVLDGLLADPEFAPKLDKTRVAAAGFSLGGYTVLALAGAETDISAATDLCKQDALNGSQAGSPSAPQATHLDQSTAFCHSPEMDKFGSVDDLVRATRKSSGESLARADESYKDPRIKAVFAIAPGMAFTLTQESLHDIKIPVEMVVGSRDRYVTPLENVDYARSEIRGARATILPNVTHYTFLDTCTADGLKTLPTYCGETNGVNRDAIHAKVAADAVEFFDRALRMR